MANKKPQYNDFTTEIKAALSCISDNRERRLVVAWGTSDYLLQKTTAPFRNICTKHDDLHYSSVEASEIAREQFQELWQQAGMFEPASIFVIRRTEKAKTFWNLLTTIPDPASITNVVVICIECSKIPVKLKKEADRLNALYIPCFAPTERELPRFVTALSKRHKIKLSPTSVSKLINFVGNDLFRLENELIKLSLIFANQEKTVNPDDFSDYLGILREDHIFKLTNFILEKNKEAAHCLTIDLIRRGESAIAIIGILARHIRNTIKIMECNQAKRPAFEIGQTVKLPAFVIKSYNRYIKGLQVPRIANALQMCQKSELDFKTSRSGSEETLIYEIIAEIV